MTVPAAQTGTAFTTHHVEITGDRVVKTFATWDRGEHRREWRGLSLLHEYAPGLGPEPIAANFDARPPSVVMSRVPGGPLGTGRMTSEQVDALAVALDRMHGAVPADVLAKADPQDTPSRVGQLLRTMLHDCVTPTRERGAEPIVCEAFEAARRTIESDWVERGASIGEPTPAFGINDGNLANFLWDAETGTVRVIDFESAGRNDRAFELADFTEHISLWLRAETEPDNVLSRLELTDAEHARLRVYRPAFAAFWLLRLLPDGAAARRNPPGTLEAQAARLLGR